MFVLVAIVRTQNTEPQRFPGISLLPWFYKYYSTVLRSLRKMKTGVVCPIELINFDLRFLLRTRRVHTLGVWREEHLEEIGHGNAIETTRSLEG
jgi:hypothetical protein